MAVAFARESLAQAWDDAEALVFANHAETGFLDQADFDPDKERYFAIEATGLLQIFTARDAGKLVAYSVVLVCTHLHYRTKKFAMPDTIFVHPDYRGLTSYRFLMWTDARLKEEGVQFIVRHVSQKRDYSRTLERMGYEPFEVSYRKVL